MVNYQQGKIYRLKSKSSNKSYVGSTAMNYLSQRLAEHLYSYNAYLNNVPSKKYVSSYEILEQEDYEIELICNYPCSNKKQLIKEEGKYIKQEKEDGVYECVNKIIAGRTSKEYNIDNRDKIKERDKNYYENNRDKILENKKEYNINNKDKISEKGKEKIECEICGTFVRKYGLVRHKRSKKCMECKIT